MHAAVQNATMPDSLTRKCTPAMLSILVWKIKGHGKSNQEP